MPCSTTSGLPMLGCCTVGVAGVVIAQVDVAFWHLPEPDQTTEDVIESFLETTHTFLASVEYPDAVDGRIMVDSYTVNPGESGFFPNASDYDCGLIDMQQGTRWDAAFAYNYSEHAVWTNNLNRVQARKVLVRLGGSAGACITSGEVSGVGFGTCTQWYTQMNFLTQENESSIGGEFELIPTYEFRRRGEQFQIGVAFAKRVSTSPYGDTTIPGPCSG